MTLHCLTIHDTAIFAEAAHLVAKHGEDAVLIAASHADAHQKSGNLSLFSHWRQVEGAVQVIHLEEIVGEIH